MTQTLKITMRPLSAFGTRPLGDTLFGQLCWAVRNRFGKERLAELLAGYTEGQPFAVVSDAFPAGYLPRPNLPGHCFDVKSEDRKAVKKRAWLPIDRFDTPVESWLDHCKTPGEIAGGVSVSHPQPHNTINRATGTTGEGQFAPCAMSQHWYGQVPPPVGEGFRVRAAIAEERQGVPLLDVYLVLDENRITPEEMDRLFRDIGAIGFGRDASIGLGKFEVVSLEPFSLPQQADADAWMTLAPSAPQGLGFDESRSFYQTFTRFGRHGDIGVHLRNPFKTPVLLAQTGAVLTPLEFRSTPVIGQGLGGNGKLSKAISETVQQGYAPVVGIRLPSPRPSPKGRG